MLYLLLALPLAGIIYQAFGRRQDAGRFPPTGRLISIGPHRLYLQATGRGSPSVILEAGIAGTSLTWALVQPRLAEFTTVASYDRAGLGWSESCSKPRTVESIVRQLSLLLAHSGLSGRYVLVGHSFGGLLVRAYAATHPEQVAGLVLVDPVSLISWTQCSTADLRRLSLGARLSRRGVWLARLGIVRAALALLLAGSKRVKDADARREPGKKHQRSWRHALDPAPVLHVLLRRVSKLIGHAASGPGTRVMERLAGEVRRLPPKVWPIVRSHWSNPKCFRAMAEYLECLPGSARYALRLELNPHVPVRIISASNATITELEERDRWANENLHGKHIRLKDCGHWIPLEQPEAVIAAVEELLADVKARYDAAS